MENDFKKPSLEVLSLINEAKLNRTNTDALINYLIKENMIFLYEKLFNNNLIKFKKEEYNRMKENIQKKVEELEKEVQTNSENELLILDKKKELAEFYAQILDFKKLSVVMEEISLLNLSSSLKMDMLLCKIRVSFILKKVNQLERAIACGRDLCEIGCDWDRRNKLKIYDALFLLRKKDFKSAGVLFSESMNTFESPELISFKQLCLYTIFCGLLSFKRQEIHDKILVSSNILEVKDDLILAIKLAQSFYFCDYSSLFADLYKFVIFLKNDPHLKSFKNDFLREIKASAYNQLLSSYKTLSLENMANIFGVTVDYLENDLIKFIYLDKLNCKIDRVTMTVSVTEESYDVKNDFLERGDELVTMVRKHLK